MTIPWRRKRLWLAAILLLPVAMGVAINLTAGRGLGREMTRWRAAGLPSNYRELDEWYRPVPAERNAALGVLAAAALHVQSVAKQDPNTLEIDPPGRPLTAGQRVLIGEYLAKNQETLARLREALQYPDARYPVQLWQGFNALITHLAPLKGLVQLLKWEALLRSAEGNRAAAVQAVRDGFGVARTLRDEPVLISELVRIALTAINLSTLERVASEHPLAPAELEALLADLAIAEADGKRAMHRAYVAERTNASFIMGASLAQIAAGGPPPGGFGVSGPSRLFGESIFLLYKASGLRQRDTRVYLETMHDYISATTNDYPAAMLLARQAETNFHTRTGAGLGRLAVMSRMLLPALLKAAAKEAVIVSRLRCADAALRIELARARGGAIPDDLSGLPARPDGVTGEPLVLVRQPAGYLVKAPGASAYSGTKKRPDIGFLVAR